jgi:hypothetical protein
LAAQYAPLTGRVRLATRFRVFGYAETLGTSDRFAVILLGNEEARRRDWALWEAQ